MRLCRSTPAKGNKLSLCHLALAVYCTDSIYPVCAEYTALKRKRYLVSLLNVREMLCSSTAEVKCVHVCLYARGG